MDNRVDLSWNNRILLITILNRLEMNRSTTQRLLTTYLFNRRHRGLQLGRGESVPESLF
jgi:hypothetical protein